MTANCIFYGSQLSHMILGYENGRVIKKKNYSKLKNFQLLCFSLGRISVEIPLIFEEIFKWEHLFFAVVEHWVGSGSKWSIDGCDLTFEAIPSN